MTGDGDHGAGHPGECDEDVRTDGGGTTGDEDVRTDGGGTTDDEDVRTDGGGTTSPTTGDGRPHSPAAPPRLRTGDGLATRLADLAGDVQFSAAVSGLAALGALLVVGTWLLGSRLTLLAVAAGVTLAAGLYALRSDTLWVLLAAGAILTPAAVLFAATLAVTVSFASSTTLAVGHLAEVTALVLVAGSFAAMLTVVPLGEARVLADSFTRFVWMVVPLTVLQVLVVAVVTWETTVVFLADLVVDSPEPLLALARALLAPSGTLALVTLLLYPVVVVYLLGRVLTTLPVATLFPPRQRPSVTERLDDVRHRLDRVVVGAAAVAGGAYALALATANGTPTALAGSVGPPLSALLLWVLTDVGIRVVLVLVIGVLVAILLGERLRRRVRRSSEADLLRAFLAPAGAFAVALVGGVVLDLFVTADALFARLPDGVRETAGPFLGTGVVTATLLVAFGSLIVTGLVLIGLTLVSGSPLLPERALGPALAATAVFALALVLTLFHGAALVALTAAAVALVVWDTGEYATGLREELPLEAPTVRGEVVHVSASLAVGVAAVLTVLVLELLITVEFIVPSVPEPMLAVGALLLAFAATVLLVSALRE